MRYFVDSRGRQWRLNLNVAVYEKVRLEAGVDLMKEVTGGGTLLSDPVAVAKVLWVMVQGQLHEKIEAAEFFESLEGDQVELAVEALVETVIDFFPPSRRAGMREVLSAARREVDRSFATGVELTLEQLKTPEAQPPVMQPSAPEKQPTGGS